MAKRKERKEKIDLKNSALIIVDVQNDFCPGGALPVPDGNKVVRPLNRMIRRFRKNDSLIVATRDWHPAKTNHFNTYGGTWPPHCIRWTNGAKFHKNLELPFSVVIGSKGFKPDEDAYSGFASFVVHPNYSPEYGWIENSHQTLEECLEENPTNIFKLFIGGLATDYCVKATVLDALKLGFRVYLLEDACRAVNINPGDGEKAIEEMKNASAIVTTIKEVLGK